MTISSHAPTPATTMPATAPVLGSTTARTALGLRVLTAVHEAGHATWYAIRGLPLDHVELRPRWWGWLPGPTVLGRCVVDGWVDDDLDAAAGALAGPEAEAHHRHITGGVPWRTALGAAYAAADGDRRDARGYVCHVGDWVRAQQAAREHVGDHWPAIEAVAAALLAHRRVEGDEVRHLARTAGRASDMTQAAGSRSSATREETPPMAIRTRKNVRVGPLRLNFTQRGFSSWSIK